MGIHRFVNPPGFWAVAQFEFASGLEFRVYAASDRLKAELQTKLIHYRLLESHNLNPALNRNQKVGAIMIKSQD